MSQATAEAQDWQVYIIECDDGSYYTGITNNLLKRFACHRAGRGAKYFRRCKPVSVVYQELSLSHREAASREYAIKQLSRAKKHQLVRRAKCLD